MIDQRPISPANARIFEAKCELVQRLQGAPLDAIKLIAACAMLVDHVNAILLSYNFPILWWIGRISFPLFAFVSAVHLTTGVVGISYIERLTLFALVTQPIFSLALNRGGANILFTLALAALLFRVVSLESVVGRAIWGAGIAITLIAPALAQSGIEFGIAGILLPIAMAHALLNRSGWWLTCGNLIVLNNHSSILAELLLSLKVGMFTLLVPVPIVCITSIICSGKRRFLPRYALLLFYPAHLGALYVLATRLAPPG